MKTNRMTRCGAAVAMAALGVGVWAGAATITWTGATSTDWATGSNWTGGPGVPQAGDDVVIDGTAGRDVALSSSTPALGTVTISGNRTLTFNGWDTQLVAYVLDVKSTGTITHTANGAYNTGIGAANGVNRVNIQVGSVLVELGGRITADAGGWQGYAYSGTTEGGYWAHVEDIAASRVMSGPGAGSSGTAGSGGAYGGAGGRSTWDSVNNATYGLLAYPTGAGSGGGHEWDLTSNYSDGGGAVYITATTVSIAGAISANGQDGDGNRGGGGSGGSIFINIGTGGFSLTGSLSANGGDDSVSAYAGYGGGGGGGRIAVWKKLPGAIQSALMAGTDPSSFPELILAYTMAGVTVNGGPVGTNGNTAGSDGTFFFGSVPEPASAALLGFAALALLRRRQRQ